MLSVLTTSTCFESRPNRMGPEDLDESSSSQFIPIDVVLKAAESCGHFVSFWKFCLGRRKKNVVVPSSFTRRFQSAGSRRQKTRSLVICCLSNFPIVNIVSLIVVFKSICTVMIVRAFALIFWRHVSVPKTSKVRKRVEEHKILKNGASLIDNLE